MRQNSKKWIKSKNVGNLDSIIRVILGLVILIAGFMMESWWGLIGLIPLFTGTVAWCPLYALFGIRTCKRDLELEV